MGTTDGILVTGLRTSIDMLGRPIVYKSRTAGAFNPAIGARSQTEVPTPLSALRDEGRQSIVGGGSQQEFIYTIVAADLADVPDRNDLIEDDSKILSVVSVVSAMNGLAWKITAKAKTPAV